MNKERVLAALVLADIVLAFSAIGAELFFGGSLPRALQDYASVRSPSAWGAGGVFVVLLWALTVSCTLVAWIGLLNLWRFARRFYVAGWAIWLLLLLVSGPSVMTPLGATFNTLECVVGGAILSLVYFSELSRHFEHRTVEAHATT